MPTTDKTLRRWLDAFMLAKRAERKKPATLKFYKDKFIKVARWFDERGIADPANITPEHLREFLVWLSGGGHNAGGIHGYYRVVRAFVRWWAADTEPMNWRDPFLKVRAPKVPDELLDPVELATVRAMVAACKTRRGVRNRAIITTLFDTGMRASELTGLDRADVDEISGVVMVRQGKGDKGRIVFLGQSARRALRAYLRERGENSGPLFLAEGGRRLSYRGLREIIQYAAKRAGVPPPPLHAFRRGFAVESLRGGMNVVELARILGHSDLETTQRYLKLLNDDLREAHARTSPADKIN